MPRRAVQHRVGTRAATIDVYVRQYIARRRGTPSVIAILAMRDLHFRVTRHDVGRALHNIGVVAKTMSPVPGLGDPASRAHYINLVNTSFTHAMQLVFIDEKKIKDGEFSHRFNEVGYAPVGARLPVKSVFLPFSFLFACLTHTHQDNPQSSSLANPPTDSAL